MRKTPGILLVTATALLLSCVNPVADKKSLTGNLSLSVPARDSRSILPTAMDIVGYQARGSGPSGATIPLTSSSSGSFAFSDLAVGSWTITVDGLGSSNEVVASGTTTVDIVASKTASASVQLVPVSGTGWLSLAVSWPSGRSVDSVTGILTDASGTSSTIALSVSGNAASYSGDLASGSYFLVLNFRLAGKIVSAPLMESVLIYANKTSPATLALTDAQFGLVSAATSFISEDFESRGLTAYSWTASGTGTSAVLPAVSAESPHAGAMSVVFNTTTMKYGYTSSLSISVNPSQDSEISFWLRTDMGSDTSDATSLQFYIDGVKEGEWNGLSGSWAQHSFPLLAGSHTLEWRAIKNSGYHYTSNTNSAYLDDVSLIPDVTAGVQLSPRSELDCYVGMDPLAFQATACRTDGSAKADSLSYSVETIDGGLGTVSSDGVFTPTTPGDCRIVATSSSTGLRGSSRVITVHPANYLDLPISYAGNAYNGKTSTGGGSPLIRSYTGLSISSPTTQTFDADGFFALEGSVNQSDVYNYTYVKVTKDGVTGATTSYLLRGNFGTRIWLRFGKGAYTVSVYHIGSIDMDLSGEGDYHSCSYSGPAYTFHVNNTRDEDGTFLYPSAAIQSDDYQVSNLARRLTFGLTQKTDQIKALHDYVVTYLYYDQDSLVAGRRKKQDALSVMKNGTAVCEGYTSLMSALLRASGFRAKAVSGSVSGGAHAWDNVLVDGSWLFLDSTWDDPYTFQGDPRISYTYFLLSSLTGVNGDHDPQEERSGRAIVAAVNPKWRGYPDGWY